MGYIYLLQNTLGYSYVGKTTKSVEDRFKEHCKNALYGLNNNLVTVAMRKYGVESFTVTELTSSNNFKILDLLERYYIQTLKTHIQESPFGLNATVGGQGTNGYKWKQESVENLVIKCPVDRNKFEQFLNEKTFDELESEFDVSSTTIHRWMKELELKKPRLQRTFRNQNNGAWSKEDEKLLIELYSSGKSVIDIAPVLNRTTTGIRVKLARLKKQIQIEKRYNRKCASSI